MSNFAMPVTELLTQLSTTLYVVMEPQLIEPPSTSNLKKLTSQLRKNYFTLSNAR
jgi:hypothetical protein